MRKKLVNYFALLLTTVLLSPAAYAINLSSNGSNSFNIGSSDLSGGAGTDLVDTYYSGLEDVRISITGSDWNYWQVTAKLSQNTWDSNLTVAVKRTSNGSTAGGGFVENGTDYLVLTTNEQNFFNGRRDHQLVGIQTRLSNVSLQVPPRDDYSAGIVFTVREQ